MTFTPDEMKRILDTLREKTQDAKAPRAGCPLCGTQNWSVQDAYAPIALMDEGLRAVPVRSDTMLSNIAVVCLNCGCVLHVSLKGLGLEDLVRAHTPSPREEAKGA